MSNLKLRIEASGTPGIVAAWLDYLTVEFVPLSTLQTIDGRHAIFLKLIQRARRMKRL